MAVPCPARHCRDLAYGVVGQSAQRGVPYFSREVGPQNATGLRKWWQMLTALNWVSVVSTVFTSAAYDEGTRQLYLKFQSGKVYRYFKFPAHQYDEFLAAESQGKYFRKHILGQFRDEEVRETQPRGNLIYFPRK